MSHVSLVFKKLWTALTDEKMIGILLHLHIASYSVGTLESLSSSYYSIPVNRLKSSGCDIRRWSDGGMTISIGFMGLIRILFSSEKVCVILNTL